MSDDPEPQTASYVLERFEDNDWAVLERDDGESFNVPRFWLPKNAVEGDVLVVEVLPELSEYGLEDEPSSTLDIYVDEKETAHHGSENGDSPLSLSRFHPETVVISAGLDNSYGHPSERALRLYGAIEAEVYRTDLQGTITITAQRDGSYEVETERQGVPQPAPPEPPTTGSVTIQCVLYNPDGEDEGREVVTLYASETTDVSGWWIEDEARHRIDLSGVYQAGESHTVGTGDAIWNNSGDTTFLYSASAKGQLVDGFSYSGGGVEACR